MMLARALAGWLLTVLTVGVMVFLYTSTRRREVLAERLQGLRGTAVPKRLQGSRPSGSLARLLSDGRMRLILAFAATSAVLVPLSGSPWGFLLALPSSMLLPHLINSIQARRRRRQVKEGVRELVESLTHSLEGGYSVLQALEFAAEDLRPPLRAELERTLADLSLGRDLGTALDDLGKRMDDPELTVLLEVLLLLKQSGGNLPEILRRLREMMRQREDLRREIKVYTAQGRLSGYIVSFLPAAFLVLESLLSPAFIRPLLQTTTGLVLLGTGLALEAAGFLCIRQMSKLEV